MRALHEVESPYKFLLIGAPSEQRLVREAAPSFEFVPYGTSDLNRLDHILLPRLLRNLDVDLTHIPLARAPLLTPSPYVVTVHDMSSILFDESPPWLRSLRKYRFSRTLARAERVISVSASTKRDVTNFTGMDGGRIRVIHNAPDPSFFQPAGKAGTSAEELERRARERRRILERYQITYPFLLYAGHIRKQKNIPRMIEAFAVARQELIQIPEYQSLRLLIIGEDLYKYPEVRRTVIQSRVEHCVRFLGFVPFDTLRVFYELATAFLFPSVYEGFGLPPLEAMAAGTAVITSHVNSLPEVVEDAAMIVNPENVFDIARGICEVLRDAELRELLVQRGLKRASAFSWLNAARQTLEVYGEVLER